MATISKPITKLLDITEETYWNKFIERYMRWCTGRALHNVDGVIVTDLQMLMANSSLSKWYTLQHEELEKQAIEVLRPQFDRIPLEKMREIHNIMMNDIFKAYPKPLIDAARKLTIINPPYDTTAN